MESADEEGAEGRVVEGCLQVSYDCLYDLLFEAEGHLQIIEQVVRKHSAGIAYLVSEDVSGCLLE